MVRSTTLKGTAFDQQTIQRVWEKGRFVPGENPALIRKDQCGAKMKRHEYGNTNSSFGWEIDHIIPESQGGNDRIENLQPLQWENNRAKGENPPKNWRCEVTV